MKNIWLLFLLPVFLTSCLAAPASVESTTVDQPQTTDAVENSTLLGTATNSLFSDSFEGKFENWLESQDTNSSYYYEDGQYFIEARNPDYVYFTYSDKSIEDGILAIDMSFPSAGSNEEGGLVLWRVEDGSNYYFLEVTQTGYFLVGEFINGEMRLIQTNTPSAAIKTDGRKNQLVVAFHDNIADIFINNTFVYSFQDDSFSTGNFGMGAATDGSSPMKVAFDNLVIFEYDPQNHLLLDQPQATSTIGYRSLTWQELADFLASDHTNWNEYNLESYVCLDFAVDLVENARAQNINAWIVGVDLEGEELGHAFVAFETSDRGTVYVEPQSDNTYSNVTVGSYLCDDWGKYECMGLINAIHFYGTCDHRHYCTDYTP